MFFDDWSRVGTLVIAALVAYGTSIVVLRITGKRTLSKLNAFDFVITIALGSLLATVVLSRDIPLAEGVLAFALLAGLQFLIAFTSVRWRPLRSMVKSSPRTVLMAGEPLTEVLHRQRVSVDELAQAVRREGFGSFADVALVVLETDGTFSVISNPGDRSALVGTDQAPGRAGGRRDLPGRSHSADG